MNEYKTQFVKKCLEKKVEAIIAIIGFSGCFFFLSPNVTGNVMGNLNIFSSNWIGGTLFVIGLVNAFIYFKRK